MECIHEGGCVATYMAYLPGGTNNSTGLKTIKTLTAMDITATGATDKSGC